jgi:Flp pilus assembly protein TadD
LRAARCIILVLSAGALLIGGCRGGGGSVYQPQTEARRDSLKAQSLTQQAAEILEKDPAKAERILREALTADLYHGPAHNNLGVLYLKQGKLYDAAGEFEWAKKLMPGHPDPRMNLALTLERAGRIDDALTAYSSALEVYPDHIQTMQALARLQVKHGRRDDNTPRYLREVAFRGDSETWRTWARGQLSK